MQNRFIDSGVTLQAFMDEILVRCPECEANAKIISGSYNCSQCHFQPKRIQNLIPNCESCAKPLKAAVCSGCGHHNVALDQQPNSSAFNEAKRIDLGLDPYFGLDLLLRVSFSGKILWFYNLRHLEYIESYLQASIRERSKDAGNNSLISRLPAWIKEAKSRNDLLKKISRLKQDATK